MHFLLLVFCLVCFSITILNRLVDLIFKLIYFLKLNLFKNFKQVLFLDKKIMLLLILAIYLTATRNNAKTLILIIVLI